MVTNHGSLGLSGLLIVASCVRLLALLLAILFTLLFTLDIFFGFGSGF